MLGEKGLRRSCRFGCGETFFTVSGRCKHYRKMHPDEYKLDKGLRGPATHACPSCGHRFSSYKAMWNHKKRLHSTEEETELAPIIPCQ